MTWTTEAQCAGMDTNLFFAPDREEFDDLYSWTQASRNKMTAARKLCVGCPVIDQCLEANMDTEDGVFGGLSSRQRESLAKKDGKWVRPVDGRKEKSRIDPDRVELLLTLQQQGLTYGEMAQETGMNKGNIHRILNNPVYNTSARPLAESVAESLRFQKNWNEPKYKAVRELIKDGRLTASAVGEITGFSAKTVRRVKYSMDKEMGNV